MTVNNNNNFHCISEAPYTLSDTKAACRFEELTRVFKQTYLHFFLCFNPCKTSAATRWCRVENYKILTLKIKFLHAIVRKHVNWCMVTGRLTRTPYSLDAGVSELINCVLR